MVIGRVRRMGKRAAERILLASGVASYARRRHGADCCILAYHNIVPDGERPVGDRSLHLSRRRFAEQLDALAETFRIVSLDDLADLDPVRGPAVAITFDDAYAGAVTVGVEELVARGLPARVFVVPGLLERRSFWWDRLAEHDTGIVPRPLREHALWSLSGAQDRVIRWAADEGVPFQEVPEHARTATRRELDAAVAQSGITLGSHTWSHPNLVSLPPDTCRTELSRSADWLAESYGALHSRSISYPYGLVSDEVARAASRTYELALGIEGGLAHRADLEAPATLVPRLNVPAGLSRDGLVLRASGL